MEKYRGDIYALLTACSWSVAVVFFKLSGQHLRTIPLKVFQNIVAVALFFGAIVVLSEPLVLDLNNKEITLIFISAFLGITLGDTLFMAAIHRIGAGMQAIVDGLYMPFVMVLALIFFDEKVPTMVIVGAFLVIIAITIAHLEATQSSIPRRDLKIGIILAVLSQITMAACVVMVKDLLVHQPILTITAYRFAIGTVILITWYLFRPERKDLFSGFKLGKHWLVTVPGTVFGPFLATLLWFAGFKYTLAGKAAVYNQLSTVLIVVLAALFLGERLSLRRSVALLIALSGGYLVFASG